jgi:O-antigen biosynthesis protein
VLYILTLNWDGAAKLEKLYNSLLPSLQDVSFKWLIKDNGSKDNSLQIIKEWNNDNVIPHDYKHNRDNFAGGCNFLFNEACCKEDDLILLLNNDTIIDNKASIKNMIDLINKDNDIGAVGCKLLYDKSKKIQHAGVVFSTKTGLLPTNYRRGETQTPEDNLDREFQAITAACMLTKAKFYENICRENKSKLNGLDTNFNWAFEDVSACLSIKYNMKKKIVYCGDTSILHEESATLNINPVNKLFMNHNVNHFLHLWKGKYDYDDAAKYLSNPKYNLYK